MKEPEVSITVLVVDDDDGWRLLARTVLEHLGPFEIRCAKGCVDGHSCLVESPPWIPDVIFMDVMMPGVDGSSARPDSRRALRTLWL